jgi:predicted nucleic acid-binding protein
MADVLLDTTVFIDYYRGHEGARSVIEQILTGALTASFSPITTLEVGLFRRIGIDEQTAYRKLMSLLDEAPLTSAVAERAAAKLRPTQSGE